MKNRKLFVILTGLTFFIFAAVIVINTSISSAGTANVLFIVVSVLFGLVWIAVPTVMFIRAGRAQDDEPPEEDASFEAMMREINSENTEEAPEERDVDALREKYAKMLESGLIDKKEYKQLVKELGE